MTFKQINDEAMEYIVLSITNFNDYYNYILGLKLIWFSKIDSKKYKSHYLIFFDSFEEIISFSF